MKPGWNLVTERFANPPSPTHTHTHKFSFILYNFFHRRTHHRERKRQRKKGRKGENGGFSFFFLFCYKTGQKALFLRPFVQLLSKPICPRALPLRILSTCARPFECARKRIILRSYPWELRRELVKLVFCFQRNRNDSASASHFSLAHTSNPCVISTRDCAHFEPFPLYSTFRYSSSCFPRWFICV